MKTIIFAIFVAIGLATPAMAQDHRGTFAPGTKCLDGSAPKHLGQIKKADGKMYDRWGCNDASSSPARTNPGPSAPRAVVAPTSVGPEASADYLAAQRASDAAALAVAKPSVASVPRTVATSGLVGMLPAPVKPRMVDGEPAWRGRILEAVMNLNDRTKFDQAVKAWASAWGEPAPNRAELKDWLDTLESKPCDGVYFKTLRVKGVSGGAVRTSQLSGCAGNVHAFYIGDKPFALGPTLAIVMPPKNQFED